MTARLLPLFMVLSGTFSMYSQTKQSPTNGLDKTYFKSKGAEFVPTGSYIDASGNIISVHAFFMTNEVTNKEYREFADDVVAHPDSSLYYFDRSEASVSKQQVRFSQIREILIDTLAMAVKYTTGSERYNKYKTYFTNKNYDDYPVVGVSYEAAKYYCIWKTTRENAALKKEGRGLMNDFRVPQKEELEYAKSFSKSRQGMPVKEVNKSKSGKPDKLGLYNLSGNVEELNSSKATSQTSAIPTGFRMVSTFLGK